MLSLTPSDGRSPTIIAARGQVALPDFKNSVRSIAQCHCESGVIWDMREAELGALHCRDIKDLVATISAVLPKDKSYPVAVIGHDALHYGLFRAFQTYAEFAGLKRAYAYFGNQTEATEWIAAGLAMKNSGLPWPSVDSAALSA